MGEANDALSAIPWPGWPARHPASTPVPLGTSYWARTLEATRLEPRKTWKPHWPHNQEILAGGWQGWP